jgi:hypothetical protein
VQAAPEPLPPVLLVPAALPVPLVPLAPLVPLPLPLAPTGSGVLTEHAPKLTPNTAATAKKDCTFIECLQNQQRVVTREAPGTTWIRSLRTSSDGIELGRTRKRHSVRP